MTRQISTDEALKQLGWNVGRTPGRTRGRLSFSEAAAAMKHSAKDEARAEALNTSDIDDLIDPDDDRQAIDEDDDDPADAGDWRADISAAIAKLVGSGAAADHDVAEQLLNLLREASVTEGRRPRRRKFR